MAVSILPLVVRKTEHTAAQETVVVFTATFSPTALVEPFHVQAEPAVILGIVSAIAEGTRKSPRALLPLLFVQFARGHGINVHVPQDRDELDVVNRLYSQEGHGVLGFDSRGECVLRSNRSGPISMEELSSMQVTPLFEQARRKAVAWLSL